MAKAKKQSIYRVDNIADVHVSPEQLAELFEVTTSQIHRLTRQEGMPKVKSGWFSVKDCVSYYCQKIRDAKKGGHVINAQREALYKQQELKARIDNAARLNELLPAEEVATVINEMSAIFATQLDGIAPRVAAIVATKTDPAEIQRIIFNECRTVRASTSAAVADIANLDNRGGNNKPAPKQKRGGVGRPRKNPTT